MPVAPSFQSMPIEGEPFTSNGKQYVKVKNEKTGKLRTVRWYSESEYAKLYPSVSKEKVNDPYYKSQKELLGFGEKGYIIAFKGDTYPHKDFFKEAGARYTRWFGWSFPTEEDVPSALPAGISAVKLYWDKMNKNDKWLASDEKIKAYVDSVMYEPSNSEYIGEVGERLDLYVKVEKVIPLDNDYGHSTLFLMRDENGNAFSWITASAKDWKAGEDKHIRGTVKGYKTYKNEKSTLLSRCSEVKK
jgi:hypothetical protein